MKHTGITAASLTFIMTCSVLFMSCGGDKASTGITDTGRIRISRYNPHYWEYNGKQILLIGGSDEDNLFNNPGLLAKNLETLAAVGGNYIRSTLSCRDDGDVWPYAGSPGSYNLDEFNPEFWARLETSLKETEKRGVIVQIELWATFDYYRENWLVNPFNPANNVNYTTDNTRLVTEWDHHPGRNPQPFFSSVPALNNDTVLLAYQQAFVKKALDVTLPYGNVLYCLDNETKAPREWAHYWGEFIRAECERRRTTVNLTEMWDQWDITHEDHEGTWRRPDIFSYTDVSQNNWQEGRTHYDRLIWYRANLAANPGGVRPMNNVKVYARLGGGRPNDEGVGVRRWWRNIFAGCAGTRFHRPPGGSGLDTTAQTQIRGARVFFETFDIFASEPKADLIMENRDREVYCLADTGNNIYAVCFLEQAPVTLWVPENIRKYTVRLFDVTEARFINETPIDRGPLGIPLVPPTRDRIWIALVRPAG